jgi:hypothetical protein
MDAEDVAQIVESLRQALSLDSTRANEVLEEFGWPELLADEPEVAVTTLFTLRGQLLTQGSSMDAVLRHQLGIPGLPDQTRVVLPPLGSHRPASWRVDEDTVFVDGVVQNGDGPLLVAVAESGEIHGFALSSSIPVVNGDPLDPTAGWCRVSGSAAVASWPVLRPSELGDPTELWLDAVAAGRRALSHELVAVGTAMAAMTVEHVRSREQFGQALGSFQAVKHQLADVHLWQEVAVLSAQASWEDAGSEGAALAKAAALRFSRTARAVCQQLLGGMGFTWEHEFHHYLRRALTLEPLLGGIADVHAELGAAVRTGSVGHSLIAL